MMRDSEYCFSFVFSFDISFGISSGFLPLLPDGGQGPETGNVTPITAGSRRLKRTHLAILILLLSRLLPLPKWPSTLL